MRASNFNSFIKIPLTYVPFFLSSIRVHQLFNYAHSGKGTQSSRFQSSCLLDIRIILNLLMVMSTFIIVGFNDATLALHLRQFALSPTMTGLSFIICGGFYSVSSVFWGIMCKRVVRILICLIDAAVIIIIIFNFLINFIITFIMCRRFAEGPTVHRSVWGRPDKHRCRPGRPVAFHYGRGHSYSRARYASLHGYRLRTVVRVLFHAQSPRPHVRKHLNFLIRDFGAP